MKYFEVDSYKVGEFACSLSSELPDRPYPLSELMFMSAAVSWYKPTHILEWGTHIGISALAFYKITQKYCPTTKIITVDIPPEVDHIEQPGLSRGMYIKNLPSIKQILGDGVDESVKFLNKEAGLIRPLFFLDGDHGESTVARELQTIASNYPNSAILLHDTFFQHKSSGYNVGPHQAIESFLQKYPEFEKLETSLGLPGMTFLYKREPPLVSVVIPVFNDEKYIKSSIQSLLNQTYKNIEVLVVDDGSTDNTSTIIKKLAKIDKRIYYYRNLRNKGIVYALNKGLSKARGVYIARMDGDDICLPERFSEQVAYLEANKSVGVCGTWIQVFGKSNYIWKTPVTSAEIKLKMFTECSLAHPSVMMRADLFTKNTKAYNKKYQYVEDYKLWIDLSHVTEFHNIPKVLLQYRTHNKQIGSKQKLVQLKMTAKLRSDLLSNLISNPTNAEKKLHFKAMSWPRASSVQELVVIRDWYLKLRKENGNRGLYDFWLFNKLLAERWVGACYLAKSLGWQRYILMLSCRPLRLDAIRVAVEIKLSSFKQYFKATIKRLYD